MSWSQAVYSIVYGKSENVTIILWEACIGRYHHHHRRHRYHHHNLSTNADSFHHSKIIISRHFLHKQISHEQQLSANGDSEVRSAVVNHCDHHLLALCTYRNSRNETKRQIIHTMILPCKIIIDRRFRGAYCLHHQGIPTTIRNILFGTC
jgi:hypothetical protein